MNPLTYSTIKSKSLSDKASTLARKKMYDLMEKEIPFDELTSVIDVGVTADETQDSSNFFEKLFPYTEKITAFSNQDAAWMAQRYKGLVFVKGDGLEMPFEDKTFDLVFSSAVIEHVGSRSNQKKFVAECFRISRKYVFITTPNRWHPIEFHTASPFFHWLPPSCFRHILKLQGKELLSSEENLNLLSKKCLLEILSDLNFSNSNIEVKIEAVKFLGFTSNLLLVVKIH